MMKMVKNYIEKRMAEAEKKNLADMLSNTGVMCWDGENWEACY